MRKLILTLGLHNTMINWITCWHFLNSALRRSSSRRHMLLRYVKFVQRHSIQSQQVGRPQFIQVMGFISASPGISAESLKHSTGWYWDTGSSPLKGWSQPAHNWRLLYLPPSLAADRWIDDGKFNGLIHNGVDSGSSYGLDGETPRTNFLIWRLLQFGFYTLSWGVLWRVSTAECLMCSQADESLLHLFFCCNFVWLRWREILDLFSSTNLSFGSVRTPLKLLAGAIQTQKQSPTRLIILAEVLWSSWREQNDQPFRHSHSRLPTSVILRNAIVKIQALTLTTRSPAKRQRLSADLSTVEQRLLLLQGTSVTLPAPPEDEGY
jgi:hypothetical protein